jgi:hypothetical protein
MLPFRELPYFAAHGKMGLSRIKELHTWRVQHVEAGARLAAGDHRPPVPQLRGTAPSGSIIGKAGSQWSPLPKQPCCGSLLRL